MQTSYPKPTGSALTTMTDLKPTSRRSQSRVMTSLSSCRPTLSRVRVRPCRRRTSRCCVSSSAASKKTTSSHSSTNPPQEDLVSGPQPAAPSPTSTPLTGCSATVATPTYPCRPTFCPPTTGQSWRSSHAAFHPPAAATGSTPITGSASAAAITSLRL